MKTKLILTALCTLTFLLFTCAAIAEIRYVSKTGTATPPYTSWATASDSIQKCINICNDGDTVIVANGVYKEHLKIYSSLTLIGMSTDSTIIDGRGIISTGLDSSYTIMAYKNLEIKNFHIFGHDQTVITGSRLISSIRAINNIIENAWNGINFPETENNAAINNIIFNVKDGIGAGDFINAASYSTIGNVIIINRGDGEGIFHSGGGAHNIIKNIILYPISDVSSGYGIAFSWPGRLQIRNNLVAGFNYQQYFEDYKGFDTVYVINNAFGYSHSDVFYGLIYIGYGNNKVVKNNILFNSLKYGILLVHDTLHPDYNLYWNVKAKYYSDYNANIVPGQNEIVADPMFVKDKVPNNNLDFDFHLQKYSPAIDAGDPDILDVDGSRSDIGMYGGEFGEVYEYLDLAPKSPRGLTASLDSNSIYLNWRKNNEADFNHYKLYSDTTINFSIDSTKLIAVLTDTFFTQPIPANTAKLYYKLTGVDNQNNQSAESDEIGVILTSVTGEPQIVQQYKLYQNYPNPFNPITTIPYRIGERGYVKLMVYDIKGELISTLVNEEKEAGYYEVKFAGGNNNPFPGSGLNKLASGIYLYRLEVTGKGRMPVYSDMKKMVFIK